MNETRGQFTHSNLKAPPSDPIGPAVSISGVASFGTLSGSPTARVNKLYEIVDNLSHQAGAHAIRVGRRLPVQRRHHHLPAIHSRQLLVFFAREFPDRRLQQLRLHADVRQHAWSRRPIRISASTRRTSGRPVPSLTLNLGLRYDLQFLKTITTDTNNVSPRAGFAWSPFASRHTVIRGSSGLFYDRMPLRALANALLSAGNTTDVANLSQISISLSPGAGRRAGVSEHPRAA